MIVSATQNGVSSARDAAKPRGRMFPENAVSGELIFLIVQIGDTSCESSELIAQFTSCCVGFGGS